MTRTPAGQPARSGRKIDLDHIRNKYSGDVRSARFDGWAAAAEDEKINQLREFWILRVLAEQRVVLTWAGSTVEVLVGDGDETFVEQWIALARHLDPFTLAFVIAIRLQEGHLSATGCGVNTDHLVITAEFRDGNRQCHQVDVEAALGILAGRAKL